MTGEDSKMKSPSKKKGCPMEVEDKINEIIVDGGGKILKMDVDHSALVNARIPVARSLAAENKLDEALDILMGLEKLARTGSDMHSTSKILVTIVQLCYEAKKWDLLNEHIIMLTKKRSQIKASVTKMVQECCTWVFEGKLPSKEVEMKLIVTLRTVTSGKIYVEVERARLTHRLAKILESEGKMEEASLTMQKLQVETYGSMDREEKVQLILEQMRYCLFIKDYIRTQIISKKISSRFFENDKHQDLKLKYYEYMIEMDQHEGSYINICRHYKAVYETPVVKEDQVKRLNVQKHMVLYAVLSPYDNEQSDMVHRILADKSLQDIPKFKTLMEHFTNMELIDQKQFIPRYEEFRTDPDCSDVFTDATEEGRKRWEDLKSRVVEHNIRIMAKYYSRITMKRMAQLLGLSEAGSEECLTSMVVAKTVEAKIDRLDGIVDFRKEPDPKQTLNDWSHNISQLMGLVMKTTHLINKEEMIHKHMLPTKPN